MLYIGIVINTGTGIGIGIGASVGVSTGMFTVRNNITCGHVVVT